MHKTANRECKELSVNLEWILYFKILVVAKGWEHQRTRYRKYQPIRNTFFLENGRYRFFHTISDICVVLLHLVIYSLFRFLSLCLSQECFAAQLSWEFYEYHMILCSLFIHWLCWKLISFLCNIKKWWTCFKYRKIFPSYYI